MQHRASDDPELQLLSQDDDSQAKSRSQTAASSDGWESEPQQYEIIPWYRWALSALTLSALHQAPKFHSEASILQSFNPRVLNMNQHHNIAFGGWTG